jgi:hypothetical protein
MGGWGSKEAGARGEAQHALRWLNCSLCSASTSGIGPLEPLKLHKSVIGEGSRKETKALSTPLHKKCIGEFPGDLPPVVNWLNAEGLQSSVSPTSTLAMPGSRMLFSHAWCTTLTPSTKSSGDITPILEVGSIHQLLRMFTLLVKFFKKLPSSAPCPICGTQIPLFFIYKKYGKCLSHVHPSRSFGRRLSQPSRRDRHPTSPRSAPSSSSSGGTTHTHHTHNRNKMHAASPTHMYNVNDTYVVTYAVLLQTSYDLQPRLIHSMHDYMQQYAHNQHKSTYSPER